MKIPLLVILLFICFTSYAQSRKIFIGNDGTVVDSSKAQSYIIYNRVSDTTWVAKQYAKDNTVLIIGTYKDASLSIPNGRFFYYFQNGLKGQNRGAILAKRGLDTLNFIETIGMFQNGLRSGQWVEYARDGRKADMSTYKNNKLNGLYELYGANDTTVTIRGQFINDLREGDWYTYDKKGDIFRTEFYQHGIITNKTLAPTNYVSAVPPDAYGDYIKKNLSRVIKPTSKGHYSVSAMVTKNGKLLHPSVTAFGLEDQEIKNKLIKIVADCPLLWVPASNSILKQTIEANVFFSVEISDGEAKFDFSDVANVMYHRLGH
jgi:antitoxin component YwqK of YwqJK toxin-antitoxin module